jgi:hypothetical protein
MIQKEGFAMGAPSSGLIAEIFLQHTEHLNMACLSKKHRIVNYFRYVDDILMIFDPNHSSIQAILDDFNALHQNLQFTAEMEDNNTLNYLDITIHKTSTSWKTAIYRKPTFTDTIIPCTSNHPTQHKYAAVKFLYNRLNTYNLQTDEYQQEEDTIHSILYNNSFLIQPQKPRKPKQREQEHSTQIPTHKWATFTYIGKETTFITNLFRYADIRIAFRTNNTIHNRLTHTSQITDKYSGTSIYRFSRGWRKQMMNAEKRSIRETTFLTKKSRTFSFSSWQNFASIENMTFRDLKCFHGPRRLHFAHRKTL